MKKCEACGLKIDDDLTRCPYCGADVSVIPTQEEIKPEEVKAEVVEDQKEDDPVYISSMFFNENEQIQINPDAKVSVWWLLAGIFIPVLGLIFALVFGRNNIAIRRKCFRGFIIGMIISIVLDIIANLVVSYLYKAGYLDQFIPNLEGLLNIL